MPKKIFIGSLSATTTSTSLLANFSPYGSIVASTINRNAAGAPVSADIEYTTDQAGTDAIAAKNGAIVDGSRISVVGR
mgnify:CR=1 FL=1